MPFIGYLAQVLQEHGENALRLLSDRQLGSSFNGDGIDCVYVLTWECVFVSCRYRLSCGRCIHNVERRERGGREREREGAGRGR